jgi:hypothetical protein
MAQIHKLALNSIHIIKPNRKFGDFECFIVNGPDKDMKYEVQTVDFEGVHVLNLTADDLKPHPECIVFLLIIMIILRNQCYVI